MPVFFTAVIGLGAEPKPAVAPTASLWDQSLTLRTGLGYKDNVYYSSILPQASAAVLNSLELMLFRLSTTGSQLALYLSADDTRYLADLKVNHEDFVVAYASYQQDLGDDWQVKTSVQYCYQDQVFDASVTEAFRQSVLARGHQIEVVTGLRRSLPRRFWAGLDLQGVRQFFEAPLDDYWEWGPRIAAGWKPGPRSEIILAYEFTDQPYIDRAQVDARGREIPGTELVFYEHDVGLRWDQKWDRSKRWSTLTRLGYLLNLENGSGYFDYGKFYASEAVRYRHKRWNCRAEIRVDHYAFPNQTASEWEASERQKTVWTASLRAEVRLWRWLGWFCEYEYEKSLANSFFDEYKVNMVSGGFTAEF